MHNEDDTVRVLKRRPLYEVDKEWENVHQHWGLSKFPFENYLEHHGWTYREWLNWDVAR